eukprot:UN08433
MKLLGGLFLFPLPTIAAINGHCFAAGVMLALACDWGIMLNNCGDICFFEVKLGIPIPIGLRELIRLKMTPNTLRTATFFGKKFSCKEALNGKIFDEMVMDRDDFLKRCVEFGKSLFKFSKNRANFSRLKFDFFCQIVDSFDEALGGAFKSKLWGVFFF